MSGRWQQCLDTNTGQPYYWNTASDQVRWDCPPEFSLPPPQLITNISLATPSTTSTTSTNTSSATVTSTPSTNTVTPTLSSLVSGYDSEDSDDDEADDKESRVPEGSEVKDDFIGPVIPKQPEKEKDSDSKRNVGEADDILSLIEAEKPPDYADTKAKLPSCKTNSRETKESGPATSMLALADYDDSDEETEPSAGPSVESGTRLDQYGRLVFNPASRSEPEWQTAEQREALLRYRLEDQRSQTSRQAERQLSARGGESENVRRFDNSRPGSRKRRLDLPKGKFNKTENLETETESEKQSVNFVPFVASSAVLPGTIELESHYTDNGVQKVEERMAATETEQSPATDDVGELTAELVEKMEHFQVGQEKVSALKTVAIKLETLYSAWTAGALSLSYLQTFLQSAMKKLSEAESMLASPARAAVWDRDSKSYQFLTEKDATNCTSLTETENDLPTCSPNPPPPPPAGPSPPPLPPSPPPPATGADHQIQDMDIEEEPTATGNITDQLSMFYSEIEGTTNTITPNGEEATTTTTNTNVENYEEESNNSSAPSSPPASPITTTGKKRKKVKVSNNLALKKKGVGDMLVKWQKIKR